MDEIWKSVTGWEGYLEVSNLGRVRTVDRLAASRRALQPMQSRKGQLLRPYVAQTGYLTISTKRDGKRVKQTVHALVAGAFVNGRFDGATVDHIDGTRTNNVWTNLRWVTRQENTRLQHVAGRVAPRGELHPGAKLTSANVRRIPELRASGLSLDAVGAMLGVSGSLVHKIERGKRRLSG